MNTRPGTSPEACAYLLRFRSLFNAGRVLAFPCDAGGRVDLDALGDNARTNYLFARACVGREYHPPVVETMVH